MPELELSAVRFEDRNPEHVAGKHVGGELDAAVRMDLRVVFGVLADQPAEGFGQRRFARSRVVLDEHVTVNDHRRDQKLDSVFAAANNARQSRYQSLDG